MYDITFKHKGSTSENILYRPGDDYCLASGKLNLEMGKAGELTVSLPVTNPAVENIVCLTDEVIVYRDSVEIWRGRPITSQQDFQLTGTLTCEGILAYLNDTYYAPFEFEGTPIALLTAILNNHNSFVDTDKQFQIGNVTVTDPNNYISRSSQDYMRTIELLSSRFVETSLGGYFRVRVVDGVKYLDYLSSYDAVAEQDVVFGENILDMASRVDYGGAITAVLPLGSRDETTGERLTVATVNSGDIYVRNRTLINLRGFICECAIWDDVTVASNLLSRAHEYLEQASAFIKTFSVKAVDLQWEGSENKAWNLGDSVRIYSEPHNINQYSELYKMSLDLLNPTNDSYDFGIVRTSNSLAIQTSKGQRNLSDSVSNIQANFHKIASTYASFDYLSANYTTTDELKAQYATIKRLDADEVNINDAIIGKADVGELNAVKADVEDLSAVSENVKVLLAGQAVTGDMQTIKLTAGNATVDGATINVATMNAASIVSLISGKITVGDLLAGKISTNKFQVGSDSGNLLISDNVITIYDDSEPDPKPRIQMGKDAQGNYTLYIGNENGTLIDENGVHENAIGDELIVDRMVKTADGTYNGIEANKLNIVSVIGALDTEGVFKASNITFDSDAQTLEQAYTAIKQEVNKNTEAIKGISSLDNLTSILSNDAHVVHTDMNGDGGDFTNAITQVSVYKGDLDVTNDAIIQVYPSSNVTGTWDASTKIYHVTALSGTDGYVDFDTAYDAAHVHKRFSISKALDGRVGVSYRLQTSASVIKRDLEDELNPSDVTFSSIYSDGTGLYPYTSGKYRIEISQDGDEWDIDYTSKQAEASTTYTPASTTRFIRCTLLSDTNLLLDTISVIIITDADALATDVSNIHTDITTINEGITGIEGHLQTTDETIAGVAKGALLYQTPFTWSNDKQTANFRAVVYKSGQDATAEFPDRWFSWWLRTEDGEEKIQDGKTFSVLKSQLGFGGTVVGRFNTYETKNLVTRNGNPLTTRSGAYLQIYAE